MMLKFEDNPVHASRNGGHSRLTMLRKILLELWAMLMMAAVVGFLGPFGTYLEAAYLPRVAKWWLLLMGAYVLVRPSILMWRAIARSTGLPSNQAMFWGVSISSVPLAALWSWVAGRSFGALGGSVGLLPFALLCAIAVLGVTWWAERAERHLSLAPQPEDLPAESLDVAAGSPDIGAMSRRGNASDGEAPGPPHAVADGPPSLAARLQPGFALPILALQSEDHYVRVHGPDGSELLLMRLRDAIAEMDEAPGEQVHRSWWVARDAVTGIEKLGRTLQLRLTNGVVAPVARESVDRLQAAGFLPTQLDRTGRNPDSSGQVGADTR